MLLRGQAVYYKIQPIEHEHDLGHTSALLVYRIISLSFSETYSTWNQTIRALARILLYTQWRNISELLSDNLSVTLLPTAPKRQELAWLTLEGLCNGFSIQNCGTISWNFSIFAGMGFILPHKLPATMEEPQSGLKWNGDLDHGALASLHHPGGRWQAVQGLWFSPGFACRTQDLQDFNVPVEWAGTPGTAGLWLRPGLLENWRETAGCQEATVTPGGNPVLDGRHHGPGPGLLGGTRDSPGVLGWDHPRDCAQVGVWGSPLPGLVRWILSAPGRVSAPLHSLLLPSSCSCGALCRCRKAPPPSAPRDDKHPPESLSRKGSVVSALQGYLLLSEFGRIFCYILTHSVLLIF